MSYTEYIEKWQKALNFIKDNGDLTSYKYETWFKQLKLHSVDGNTVTLVTENAMQRSVLQQRYLSLIQSSVSDIFEFEAQVNIILEDEAKKLSSEKHEKPMSLNPKYTFDTFVVGDSNRFAHAAALAVAEMPGGAYNPLFIHGGVGLGKTHLMNAISHYILDTDPNKSILFMTSEAFVNEVVDAIARRKNQELRQKLRSVDVLLIDDVQFISNKTATQEEFFHTFNDLYQNGKQIVLSSDRPPREIQALEERLRSRFMSGLIVDIQKPNYETRLAILRKKADLEKIEIGNNVLDLIANRVTSNIRELEGALIRVKAHASLENKPIDMEIAENALDQLVGGGHSNKITVELIINQVAEKYHITYDDILSARRQKNLALPRQIAMYLALELTGLSTVKIGEAMGGRDHTTVMYGAKKIKEEMLNNSSLLNQIETLTKEIRNS